MIAQVNTPRMYKLPNRQNPKSKLDDNNTITMAIVKQPTAAGTIVPGGTIVPEEINGK